MKELQDSGAGAREDEWLTVRCQLGERLAFDELIQRWGGPVWNYLRRMTCTDDAAEEVLQDVWLRVLRGINRLRDRSKLRPWLFGIARRALMDRLREHYAASDPSNVDVANLPANNPPDDIEGDLAVLHQELDRLPVVEREVLMLFYLKELNLGEVAEVLGVPVGTVKSRLYRARKLLRREVELRTGNHGDDS